MCITNPLKISDFQGNLLHMLLFSQKHAFYFSILRIRGAVSMCNKPQYEINTRKNYAAKGLLKGRSSA